MHPKEHVITDAHLNTVIASVGFEKGTHASISSAVFAAFLRLPVLTWRSLELLTLTVNGPVGMRLQR